MFRSAWTVMNFRGVPIKVHPSFLIILPLVAWAMGTQTVPHLLASMDQDPGLLVLHPFALGAITSLSLFVAVLVHELGHAYAALRQGARVRGVTLMILGGVTEIDQEEATATQALRTAVAGPFVNLGIGAVAMLLVPFVLVSLDLYVLLFLFASLNLFLGLFNLIPAYPLDGARALASILAHRMTRADATRWVSNISRFVAAAGLCFALARGDFILGFFALFLFFGAAAEVKGVETRDALVGLAVRQAMCVRVVTVGPDRPTTSVARHMLIQDARAAIVRDVHRVYGVVLLKHLHHTGIEQVGSLVDGQPLWGQVNDPLAELAREIRWQRKPAIVRDESNSVVGVVTNTEILNAAELKRIADRSLGVSAPGVENPQSHS